MELMKAIVIGVDLFFLTFILLYSLSQFNLAMVYLKRKRPIDPLAPKEWPMVTIQLPLYNEKYVVERLVQAICTIDYPKDKLEIQLLDDSSDETVELVANLVNRYSAKGFQIEQIRRPNRVDYKAGALKYGTGLCRGEFIAIFDADFVPRPDFLKKAIPHFVNDRVGVVQSRWGHINENYSVLTKLQSFALNAHFTVEQGGRNSHDHFINFNGTAGIWRKATIEDAGGWQGDTITEDLDLSYRAQIKQWEFVYLEGLESPAELPPEMNALKSQQYRWAKGAAECARKNLGRVFRAKDIPVRTKFHALFHLLNSFTWLCLIFSAILSVPLLFIIEEAGRYADYIKIFGVYQVSFVALFVFYLIANAQLALKSWKDYALFLIYYPAFLTLSMGISLNNALGVIRGYLGIRSAFVRTPKFNVRKGASEFKNKSYVKLNINGVTLLEMLCSVYFIWGSYISLKFEQYAAFPFLLMMALGFILVLFFSVYHKRKAEA